MKRIFYAFVLTGLFVFLINNNALAQAKKPAKPAKLPPDKILNNKTFDIILEQQGGKKKIKPEPDEMSFKAQKLISVHFMEEHFFLPSGYTVTVDTVYEESEEPAVVEVKAPVVVDTTAVVDSLAQAPAPVVPARKFTKIYIFESNQINDLKDELKWKGQIIGDSITGVAKFISPKQKGELDYIFNGKMRGKPGKKIPAKK